MQIAAAEVPPCFVSTNSLRRMRKRAQTVVKDNWLPRDISMRTKGMALPVKGGSVETTRGHRGNKAAADKAAIARRAVAQPAVAPAGESDPTKPMGQPDEKASNCSEDTQEVQSKAREESVDCIVTSVLTHSVVAADVVKAPDTNGDEPIHDSNALGEESICVGMAT